MSSADQLNIELEEVEAVTAAALQAHGATAPVAASVAHAVRVAEANNNRICGLYYVESYCSQLASGRVFGDVEPVVSHDKPGSVRVDAKYGFAQWAFQAGLASAVQAAKDNGTCGFSIEHSHTCTSLGYFTEQLAAARLVAIGSTNSSARVSPPGGSTPILGTNPMAMAVPARNGGVAFQFDYSTSAIALGKITMAAAAGDPIPVGWAVDANGNDTTDPNEALKGSLVSAGGYKGYGLGLMVEILASALTGGRSSVDIPPLKAPEGPHHDIGQFYLLIDPNAFAGPAVWDRVEALTAAVEDQPGARLPGAGRGPDSPHPDTVTLDPDLWTKICGLAS